MAKAQDLGKQFQDDIQEVLSAMPTTERAFFHRLYDSRSAGAYLPDQPGDFILLYHGGALLIECKSSTMFDTLAGGRRNLTSLFSDQQVASMRLWLRAGGVPMVLFKSHNTGIVEAWGGGYIADCYLTPKRHALPETDPSYHAFEFAERRPALLALLRRNVP